LAQYRITYRNSTETVEAKSKADAVKRYRDTVAPSARLKDLLPHLMVERVKVVKVNMIKCAICDDHIPRGGFVEHVRKH
jgi:hypothetical protein